MQKCTYAVERRVILTIGIRVKDNGKVMHDVCRRHSLLKHRREAQIIKVGELVKDRLRAERLRLRRVGDTRSDVELEIIGDNVKHVWVHVCVHFPVGRRVVARSDEDAVSLCDRNGEEVDWQLCCVHAIHLNDLAKEGRWSDTRKGWEAV